MKKFRFLVVFLLIAGFALTPFASASAISPELETAEVTRIGEVESLRETNSETYLMSDGTYECVVYAENKYYLDENEVLQPIDNTIVAVRNAQATKGLQTSAATQYTNTANAFDVFFSGSGTPQISISYGDAAIAFAPINAVGEGKRTIDASSSVISVGAVRNCAMLHQLTATGSNTASYENVFGTADLVYVLDNDTLKEYIILEDNSAPSLFQFQFALDGVTLQETDTGALFLNAEGEAVFTMGNLFAIDANGVITDKLTYTFRSGKDNTVSVTVTLDDAYLKAAERAFPVIIDPSITISSSSTADACVCDKYPTTNYYLATQLRTGYDTDYGKRRSYVRFSIPDSIEVGSVISAYLDIEKISGVAPTMRAYRVTGSWSSSTITWKNKPEYTTTHQSTQSVQRASGSSWYRMNVTSMVNAWVDGYYMNYGFVLIDSLENDPNHWTTLYSSDANSPHKPELHINYSGSEIPTTPTIPTNGAVLIGVTNTQHDHASWMATVESCLENCGYSVSKYTGAFTTTNIDTYISSSQNSIFVSRSHGDYLTEEDPSGTQIILYTCLRLDDYTYGVTYAAPNIPSITNMDLVAFIACNTAYGGEGAANLPTYAVSRGAETAIGFTEQILCTQANEWTKAFFALLENGYSVKAACEDLETYPEYRAGNLDSYIICGNKSKTIN